MEIVVHNLLTYHEITQKLGVRIEPHRSGY